MIDLYSWATPNGHKIHIMLEETGLPYAIHPVNIGKGDQFKPDFLKISPNNKMPAIVDTEGPDGKPISIFESGAILLYLGQKTGKFLPKDPRGYWEVMQWLMFQMGGVGPMFGQANHFMAYAPEKIDYAVNRYRNEVGRLYGVMERRLADRPFIAGEYSIADMALYPWCQNFERRQQKPADFPNVKRWVDAVAARPAVQRGMKVLTDQRREGPHTPEEWKILFGEQQYVRR